MTLIIYKTLYMNYFILILLTILIKYLKLLNEFHKKQRDNNLQKSKLSKLSYVNVKI